MRVSTKPSSPGAAPASGVAKPAASPSPAGPSAVQGPEAVGDALSVSSTAQFIAVAEAQLALVPDIRMEKVDALNRVVVTAKDGAEHAIAFDEAAYALSLEGGYEYDTDTVRFVYNSMTTPRQWFDYDMAKRTRTLRKTQEIPSGHDPSKYETRRLNAKAADGAEVPIFVLMKKGTKLDGSAPLLLYGYGSYGISMEPSFSIRNFSLVDRGWIWATACPRGGSDG